MFLFWGAKKSVLCLGLLCGGCGSFIFILVHKGEVAFGFFCFWLFCSILLVFWRIGFGFGFVLVFLVWFGVGLLLVPKSFFVFGAKEGVWILFSFAFGFFVAFGTEVD